MAAKIHQFLMNYDSNVLFSGASMGRRLRCVFFALGWRKNLLWAEVPIAIAVRSVILIRSAGGSTKSLGVTHVVFSVCISGCLAACNQPWRDARVVGDTAGSPRARAREFRRRVPACRLRYTCRCWDTGDGQAWRFRGRRSQRWLPRGCGAGRSGFGRLIVPNKSVRRLFSRDVCGWSGRNWRWDRAVCFSNWR